MGRARLRAQHARLIPRAGQLPRHQFDAQVALRRRLRSGCLVGLVQDGRADHRQAGAEADGDVEEVGRRHGALGEEGYRPAVDDDALCKRDVSGNLATHRKATLQATECESALHTV